MRVNIDCTPILLLLSGMLALLKIGGQFPYSWIWVLAPIWIPLLALAGITIILLIAWIIGVIGVLILEKFGDYIADQRQDKQYWLRSRERWWSRPTFQRGHDHLRG